MIKRWGVLLILLSVAAFAGEASAQSDEPRTPPHLEWRTIETEHFRVHFPADYGDWATRAAERLESNRALVSSEVGFEPPQKIDVIVENPTAEANGLALPFLDHPRMVLNAEPPGPERHFGAYGHWVDLVTVHETAHLVQMLRPSRGLFGRVVEKLVIPLNSITLSSPRWALEGYATQIEGRLTGAGRPTSTIRALILRRWAAEGRLPTYAQLDSDSENFLGMSMAYLAGSAFLDWLVEKEGKEALPRLWRHITARSFRDFDQAFTDVFGDSPRRMYGRFTAELTASALRVEREREVVAGERFQDTKRNSGDPAVSPDGMRIAVVLREKGEPDRLVVWSTGAAEKEEKKYREDLEKQLARDPQDIEPKRVAPLSRQPLEQLTMPDQGDIDLPRWMPDGKGIVFSHRSRDGEGMLRHDLYLWNFDEVRRITHEADVFDAGVAADGKKAIAVRSRFGKSQLVDVELTTGAVEPRAEASLDRIPIHPRWSASGSLAYVLQRDSQLALVIDGREIALPGDVASPEWLDDDTLVATLFRGGFAELIRVRRDGSFEQLTSAPGGAFDPAPAKDGRIFFMSLDPDGYVLRVLTKTDAVRGKTPSHEAALVPAIPPTAGAPAVFARQAVSSRPYGLGAQEQSWLAGFGFSPGQKRIEAGIRLGDVIGRLDTLLIAGVGSGDAPSGLAVASAWRGWPIEVSAHAFVLDESVCPDDYCAARSGLELRSAWERRFGQSRVALQGGALSGARAFGGVMGEAQQSFGSLTSAQRLSVDVDGDHLRGRAELSAGTRSIALRARYELDRGANVTLGGLASSLLPDSAFARQIEEGGLRAGSMVGERHDGLRFELSGAALPIALFWQRHDVDGQRTSLAGLSFEMDLMPNALLKLPALQLVGGAARIFDGVDRGDDTFWLSLRLRP